MKFEMSRECICCFVTNILLFSLLLLVLLVCFLVFLFLCHSSCRFSVIKIPLKDVVDVDPSLLSIVHEFILSDSNCFTSSFVQPYQILFDRSLHFFLTISFFILLSVFSLHSIAVRTFPLALGLPLCLTQLP